MQAAKFGLEAGVIVRSQVPTLTHWNQYMEQTEHFDSFMGRLSVSAYVLVLLHSTLFPMAVVQLGFYFWSPGEVSVGAYQRHLAMTPTDANLGRQYFTNHE